MQELTGNETLIEELEIVGEIRQGSAVLIKDSDGYHMYDSRNPLGKHRHNLEADTNLERLEAHWSGFVSNVRGR
jgi:hypothetical protein